MSTIIMATHRSPCPKELLAIIVVFSPSLGAIIVVVVVVISTSLDGAIVVSRGGGTFLEKIVKIEIFLKSTKKGCLYILILNDVM